VDLKSWRLRSLSLGKGLLRCPAAYASHTPLSSAIRGSSLRANLRPEPFLNGGAPLRALRVNQVPIGDTKTHGFSDLHPQTHIDIGNPRIKSEPILVSTIAWLVCWKLRESCFPLVSECKLLGPGPEG